MVLRLNLDLSYLFLYSPKQLEIDVLLYYISFRCNYTVIV